MLAIVFAIKHFRPYLYGHKFTLVTDHRPLIWLNNLKDPVSRLARWRIKLSDHDYEITYKRGVANSNADALSRNPPDLNKQYEQSTEEMQVEKIPSVDAQVSAQLAYNAYGDEVNEQDRLLEDNLAKVFLTAEHLLGVAQCLVSENEKNSKAPGKKQHQYRTDCYCRPVNSEAQVKASESCQRLGNECQVILGDNGEPGGADANGVDDETLFGVVYAVMHNNNKRYAHHEQWT